MEISSTDKKMQALIDSIDKTYHITGSYTGEARFTEQLGFSDGIPIDITIEGIFGMSDNDDNVIIKQ